MQDVPTLEPRGLNCTIDIDKDDMNYFRAEVWPRWLVEAVPPVV